MSAYQPSQITSLTTGTSQITDMISAIMPIIVIMMMFMIMKPMMEGFGK